MDIVLITGTSKGLGLELAQCYLDLGYCVIGVSRSESKIVAKNYHHFIGDVTDKNIANGLKQYLVSLSIRKIDIVINNAGTGSCGEHLSLVEPDEMLKQLDVHCVGALRILKGVREFLNNSKLVNVTSRLASTAQNIRGDFVGKEFSYSYRVAKSAQNMLSLCLSNDPELFGTKVISLNPGLLLTDSGSSDARHTAKEGAEAFIATVNEANSSGIYHAFGEEALY